MLTITVGSTIYNLSNGTLCYYVGQDGLGLVPPQRFRDSGPLQDGETDLGWRIPARVFSIFLDVPGDSATDIMSKRAELLRIFRPRTDPLTLTFTAPNCVGTRAIKADTTGGLQFASSQRQGFLERVQVTLSARNYTFYDPALVSVLFSLGAVTGAWEIPWAIPWPIGSAMLDSNEAIVYAGDAESYPVIYITGPITAPKIENLTTGKVLEFEAGITIAAGDVYTIDLSGSYKRVYKDGDVTDIRIHELTPESNLSTFALVPDEDGAATYINTIRVTGSGVTSLTSVLLTYYNRFVGI